MKFEHITLGQRVLFGAGRAAEHVAQEAARLSARNIMCITSEFERPFAETAMSLAEVTLWHTDVVQHVPVETAAKARQAASDAGIDLIVCVGGGSTTGLAKAVALTTGHPHRRCAHHLRGFRSHERVGPDGKRDQDNRC